MRKLIFVFLLVSCMAIALNAADFWQPPAGPHGGHVTTILRTSDGVIYLGTFTTGIFKSNNNGQSWQSVNDGLSEFQINTLANDNENLYAAVGRSGVYFSTDKGATWSVYSSTIRDESIQAIFVESNGDMLIAARGQGIYKSSDSGQSWRYSGLKGKIIQTIAKSPTGDLFAAGNDGVYRFDAAGQSWEKKSQGIPSITVKTLAFSETGAIFCGTYGAGVLRSDDNGETWTPKLNGFKSYIHGWIEQLLFDTDGTLWAAVSHEDFGGLYFTSDGGDNWYEQPTPVSQKKYLSLLIHGDDMFLGVYKFGIYHARRPFEDWTPQTDGFWFYRSNCLAPGSQASIFSGTSGGGIFRCDDGRHWLEKNVGVYEHDVQAMHRTLGDTLFAGVFPKGLLRSTDNGESWSVHNVGLHNLNIHCFAHDSQGRIFLGNNLGLAVSDDKGQSWNAVNLPLSGQPVMSLFATAGDLYIGTKFGRVLVSPDGGASWDDISTGLPALQVSSIIQYSGRICVGVLRGGVYQRLSDEWLDISADLPSRAVSDLLESNGKLYAGTEEGLFEFDQQNWLPRNSGLANMTLHDLCFDAAGFLWAATDIGVARSAAKITGVADNQNAKSPSQIQLYAPSPNPFNASTTIAYQLVQPAFVILQVFDVMGRPTQTLVNEQQAAGRHVISWNAENSPSGIYFVRLQAENQERFARIVLQK